MSAPTVADALTLADLPLALRQLLADEVRQAFVNGYRVGVMMARADAAQGMAWSPLAIEPCADMWQWDHVRPLLGGDAA